MEGTTRFHRQVQTQNSDLMFSHLPTPGVGSENGDELNWLLYAAIPLFATQIICLGVFCYPRNGKTCSFEAKERKPTKTSHPLWEIQSLGKPTRSNKHASNSFIFSPSHSPVLLLEPACALRGRVGRSVAVETNPWQPRKSGLTRVFGVKANFQRPNQKKSTARASIPEKRAPRKLPHLAAPGVR